MLDTFTFQEVENREVGKLLTGADLGKILTALQMGVALRMGVVLNDACAARKNCYRSLKLALICIIN